MTESVFCRTERANLAQSIESSVRNTTNLKMEKALSYVYTLQ